MHQTTVFFLVLLAAKANIISSAKITTTTTTTSTPDTDEIDQGDPFQYSYNVEADINSTRVEQSKAETSNGQEVVGQYKVLLPDGRLQTVTYTSGPDGYKATVQYAQVGQSVTTQSSGRSFTVARTVPLTKTTSKPTATTTTSTTTTTTTSRPAIVPVTGSVQLSLPSSSSNVQTKMAEPIDGRISTSARSRQRSNRTRAGGESFRPALDSSSSSSSSIGSSDVALDTVRPSKSVPNDEPTRRSRPGSLKKTWNFDESRQRPEDVVFPDYDY